MDVLGRNRKAFAGQAKGFSPEGDTFGDAEEIRWMLAELPLESAHTALDIATGTGEFARALSKQVALVIGIDATETMLKEGESYLRERGIDNISFRLAVAEALPYEDQSFDVVTSRFAFHHFADPKPVLSEMTRVCRPGGHVLVVDIVPPDPSAETEYNYYEWLRDDSHTRCLAERELQTFYALFGLDAVSARSRDKEIELLKWLDFARPPEEHRQEVLRAIEAELGGGTRTGLRALQEGRHTILHAS